MNQVIDPVTGMAVPVNPAQQMIQQPVQQPAQPINVGMPGSTVIPPTVAHNMTGPLRAGGKVLSPVRSTDPPETQKKITSYIKGNMNKMSDDDLMKGIGNFNPDGKTEYNWNKKTGEVEAHDKQGPSSVSGGKNPNVGKPYKQ